MKKMSNLLILLGIAFLSGGIYLKMQAKSTSKESTTAETTTSTETPQRQSNQNKNKENKDKGNAFEAYMIYRLTKGAIKFQSKATDYNTNNVRSEDSKEPDLKFYCQFQEGDTKYPFAVECKYRSTFTEKGNLTWTYEAQKQRYQDYQKTSGNPVFVAIGVGGKSDAPAQVYIVPLEKLQKVYVHQKQLAAYQIDPTKVLFYNTKKGQEALYHPNRK